MKDALRSVRRIKILISEVKGLSNSPSLLFHGKNVQPWFSTRYFNPFTPKGSPFDRVKLSGVRQSKIDL